MSDDKLRRSLCAEVARSLREERLRQKYSLNALSARAGLSRQTVSFLEQGERIPTLDTLFRITAALDMKLEDLIKKAREAVIKLK